MASNIEEAGTTDSTGQILINCARALGKSTTIDETLLERFANEYTTANTAATDLLTNKPIFKTLTRLLEFPHHQNMGRPPVKMFASWLNFEGHGPVSVPSLSLLYGF